VFANDAVSVKQRYLNKAYKDIQMNKLIKITVPVLVIIVSALFYSEEILTVKNSLKSHSQEDEIAMNAFYLAMETQTITALKDFIVLYPTHSHVELIQSNIERLQYAEVVNKNTIEACDLYLNDFPASRYTDEVSYKRAILINTIAEYESYVVNYPKGNFIKNALYKKARLINTVDGYNAILENDSVDNDAVIYYRDKAALEAVKKINTKKAYLDFIEKYPDSSLLSIAKYERDKMALKSAKKIGTKKAFGKFVDNYPDSAWINEAKYYYTYGYKLN